MVENKPVLEVKFMRKKFDTIAKSILVQAFFKVENAVIVAVALLLWYFLPHPFPFWQAWMWLIFGVVGIVVITAFSLNEEDTLNNAIDGMLAEKYPIEEIRNPANQATLRDILNCRREIEKLLRSRDQKDIVTGHIVGSLDRIDEWTNFAYRLAVELDHYQNNSMLDKDPQKLQAEIETLRGQMKWNTVAVKDREDLLQAKQARLKAALSLGEKMDSISLQLQQCLESVRTIYQQLSLVDSTQNFENYDAVSIRSDIEDQVDKMNHLLSGLEKAYHGEE
jgi:hypothetical protein